MGGNVDVDVPRHVTRGAPGPRAFARMRACARPAEGAAADDELDASVPERAGGGDWGAAVVVAGAGAGP